MAYIPEKLIRIQKRVLDNLKYRLKKLDSVAAAVVTISEALDAANGAVSITVNVDADGGGAGVAADIAFIRFVQWDATTPDKLDGIGLTQRVYSPSKAQVVIDGAGTVTNNGEVINKVMSELAKSGIAVEVYYNATVSGASIASANYKYTIDSIEYPLLSTI